MVFTIDSLPVSKISVCGATGMTWFSDLLDNPLMKSFIAYSIFRAFYGAGILVVTYFVDRETAVPWWLFLAFSMVFSRILFRWIKSRRSEEATRSPS
tara:strand:+ start:384 stop:674 length:291 start_codon:yes stop_codon:yes gene_type:complete